jgi:hypothetical protein
MNGSNEDVGINGMEDVERHQRAHADASVCCRCGRSIPAGAAVWLLPCRLLHLGYGAAIWIREDTVVAACDGCGALASQGKDRLVRDARCCRASCPGCKRPVYVFAGSRSSGYCSDRCRNRVHGARHRARNPKPKGPLVVVQCQVCDRNFVAKRSGAKTCSSACRQKAYRTRVTLAAQVAH